MEEYSQSQEFRRRCGEENIHIEDERLYCNEGVLYEFSHFEDLEKAIMAYLDTAVRDSNGINVKFTVKADLENCTYLLFDSYPDEL